MIDIWITISIIVITSLAVPLLWVRLGSKRTMISVVVLYIVGLSVRSLYPSLVLAPIVVAIMSLWIWYFGKKKSRSEKIDAGLLIVAQLGWIMLQPYLPAGIDPWFHAFFVAIGIVMFLLTLLQLFQKPEEEYKYFLLYGVIFQVKKD